jgi:hypothetical protein
METDFAYRERHADVQARVVAAQAAMEKAFQEKAAIRPSGTDIPLLSGVLDAIASGGDQLLHGRTFAGRVAGGLGMAAQVTPVGAGFTAAADVAPVLNKPLEWAAAGGRYIGEKGYDLLADQADPERALNREYWGETGESVGQITAAVAAAKAVSKALHPGDPVRATPGPGGLRELEARGRTLRAETPLRPDAIRAVEPAPPPSAADIASRPPVEPQYSRGLEPTSQPMSGAESRIGFGDRKASPGSGVESADVNLGKRSGGARSSLVSELERNGVKHTPENIVSIARDPSGKVVFLETGDSVRGLQHIVERHVAEFAQRGIPESQIPDAVMKAVTEGKQVGFQGADTGPLPRRPIFEVEFNGRMQRIAVTVGDNGFIVGANLAR